MTHLLDNHWRHDFVDLCVPALPDRLKGDVGAFLERGVFDTAVGEEVYVAILDFSIGWDLCFPPGAKGGERDRIALTAKCGAALSSQGLVAFILWELHRDGRRVNLWEQMLNPFHPGTLALLQQASRQSHLKAVLLASESSEVRAVLEFKNVYGFDAFLKGMGEVSSTLPPCDFAKAQAAFMAEISMEKLLIS